MLSGLFKREPGPLENVEYGDIIEFYGGSGGKEMGLYLGETPGAKGSHQVLPLTGHGGQHGIFTQQVARPTPTEHYDSDPGSMECQMDY